MKDILLKISSGVIIMLLTVLGTLAMNILIHIQTDVRENKRILNGICDTQAAYWPNHACKR